MTTAELDAGAVLDAVTNTLAIPGMGEHPQKDRLDALASMATTLLAYPTDRQRLTVSLDDYMLLYVYMPDRAKRVLEADPMSKAMQS